MTTYTATLHCDGNCGQTIVSDARHWPDRADRENAAEAIALGWLSRSVDSENRKRIWLCPKCAKNFTAPALSVRTVGVGGSATELTAADQDAKALSLGRSGTLEGKK